MEILEAAIKEQQLKKSVVETLLKREKLSQEEKLCLEQLKIDIQDLGRTIEYLSSRWRWRINLQESSYGKAM